jgi:colicin import membrane protein
MKGEADDWAPVAHEDILAQKPAKPAAAEKKPPKPKPEPEPEREPDPPPPPAPAELTLPSSVEDGLADLAWSQHSLADKLGVLATSLDERMKGMEAAILAEKLAALATAMDERMKAMEAAIAAAQQPVIAAQQAMASQIQELASAGPALADSIAGWTETIEQALRAPRRVTLERGADGLATGAVSTVVGGIAPDPGMLDTATETNRGRLATPAPRTYP